MTIVPRHGLMGNNITEPHPIPFAFLPATSDVPSFSQLSPALLTAMQRCITTTDSLVTELQSVARTPVELHRALVSVAETLNDLHDLLMPVWQAMQEQSADDSTHAAKRVFVADMNSVMADACTIYDDYFCVVRTYPMTQIQLMAQVTQTGKNVLQDLPHVLLDRAQITVLLQSIAAMIHVFASGNQSSLGNSGINHESRMLAFRFAGDNQQATQKASIDAKPQQSDAVHDKEWTEQVAHYRWKVGHHLFNLCTIFCRYSLQQARKAIVEGRPAQGTQQLCRAEQFLRGTTAAMWYAGDFPPRIYQQIIRPSMVMPGSPAGFSGDQNADYNRMKDEKATFKTFISTYYDPALTTAPADLLNALRDFHEADVQDVEHHLLIAANKVGSDHSLAQKEWMAELPDSVHVQRAIDVLRKMAEMRRQEFTV